MGQAVHLDAAETVLVNVQDVVLQLVLGLVL